MSLRTRLFGSVTLLALLALGLAGLTAWQADRLARSEGVRQAEDAHTLLARALETAREDARLVSAMALSLDPVLEGGEGCAPALGELLREAPRFENLVRFDPDGNILCTGRPYPLGQLPQGERTSRSLERLDAGESFVLTAAFVDPDGRALLLFSRGVDDQGSVGGGILVGVLLDMDGRPILPGWPSHKGLVLADAAGRVALHLPRDLPGPGPAAAVEKDELGATPESLASAWGIQSPSLASWLDVPDEGAAFLLVAGPLRRGSLTPATAEMVQVVGMVGGVLLLGFFGVLLWLQASVVPPLAGLSKAATSLAGGHRNVRIGEAETPDELRPLARAFNRMAQALDDAALDAEAAARVLRESEARYRLLFAESPFAMWVYDPESLRIVDANRAAEEVYGYTREELLHMTPLDLRAPEEHGRFHGALAAVRAGVDATEPAIWVHRHRDGRTLYVEHRGRTVEIGGRRLRIALGTNVTERILAEQGRDEAERRLNEILANTRDCVWMQDIRDRRVLFVSEGYRRIWGRDPEGIVSGTDSFLETVHPDDRAQTREARGVTSEGGYEEEYRILRPDGEIRWIRDRSFPIRDAEGEIYRIAGIATDITERRRLEDQLVVSQRLEAVGQLAGGMAHDFNNLLTVIQGRLALARMDVTLPPAVLDDLDDAEAAARRAGALVQHLLAFSRRQILVPEVVDLGEIIRGAERFLRRVIPQHIEWRTPVSPIRLPVRVDAGKLEQALLNLTLNARDAMPRGGVLEIQLREEQGNGDSVPGNPGPSGACAVVEVRDTGEGMDAATLRLAFEPFFTTKEPGKGSGLGLSMVHGMVEQSGGHVQIESTPGVGTTVRLVFPLHQDAD